MEWKAGVAEREITPPLGVSMTGYAGRPGPADHVLDRLFVRALAVQGADGPPVALVGLDVLGLELNSVAAIRAALLDELPAERLLLNCSHTHAGPTTAPLRCMGTVDQAYVAMLGRLTASAVREALRGLRPAALKFGTAPTAIGVNRRESRSGKVVLGENPAGAYDPAVSVLRLEDERGAPLACWFSHATHPVIMDPSNTGLSAEWPGEAASVLSTLLGCPAVFGQGCCGDINPRRRGGHDVARSVGRELAGAALAAWELAEPVTGSGTAPALERVLLPQRQPSPEEADAALAEAKERHAAAEAAVGASTPAEVEGQRRRLGIAAEMVEWAEDYLAAAHAPSTPGAPMDVLAIRLGDLALVATAAETFVEIGQQIASASPVARTVALGYTNGCFGYLPTAKAFPLGGYEIDGAHKYYGTLMVTPECEQRTLDAAARVLTAVNA